MCYQGEAHSIQLCDECSVNSQTLSIDCRYFKRNLHTIHLDVEFIRCLGECWTKYKCVPYVLPCSLPHASFTLAIGCKCTFTWKMTKILFSHVLIFLLYDFFFFKSSLCSLETGGTHWRHDNINTEGIGGCLYSGGLRTVHVPRENRRQAVDRSV